MRKLIIMLVITILITGCAARPVKIFVDGYPLSEREYIVRHGSLTFRYYLSRWFERKLNSYEIELYPEHIEKDRMYVFPTNTNNISFQFLISNPENYYYKLFYIVDFYTKDRRVRRERYVAYKGQLTQNEVKISVKAQEGYKKRVKLYVLDKEGKIISKLGQVSFKIK